MQALLQIIAVAAAVTPFAWYNRMNAQARGLHSIVMFSLCAPVLGLIVGTVALTIKQPPLWDFVCFWVYGRAAAQGNNPYSPAILSATAHALGIHASPSFTAEVLHLGAVYPPPSLLLFAPLGMFTDAHAASAFWMVFQLAALAGLAWMLWRLVFRAYGVNGAVAAVLLSCAFPSTFQTLSLGQTVLPATLLCALFVFDPNHTRRGLWLAVGAAVKPLLVIPVLYLAARREFRAIFLFAGTVLFMSLACAALAGVRAIDAFVRDNPAAREPAYLFHESQYQSLAAMMLRASHNGLVHGFSLTLVVFAVYATLLVVTVAICGTAAHSDDDLCAGAFIALSLLLYPATAHFYGDLLLIPLVALWLWCIRRGTNLLWPALLFVTEAVLLSRGDVGNLGLLAFLLTWLTLISLVASNQFATRNRRLLQSRQEHVLDGH